jgi:hypothetical protein
MHGISRLGLADDPIFTGIYGDMRAGHRHRSSGNVILCESGASGDNQRLVVRNLHRIAAIKAGDPNGLGSGAVGIEAIRRILAVVLWTGRAIDLHRRSFGVL